MGNAKYQATTDEALMGRSTNESEEKLKTPIEIALGIDENGMTTARKLFDFLEMNVANYARWIKRNITNNEFAEENVDYFPFVIDEECEDNKNSSARKSLIGRGNSEDYKLSSAFAKKLSMQQKNEREGNKQGITLSVSRTKQRTWFLS